MNNDIKEILEDVERHLDYVEATKQASIRDNEMKVMYDYITNLEQENEIYFKKNNELSTLNTSLRSDRDNYKQRNEKAIEYIKEELSEGACNCVSGSDLPYSYIEDLLNILKGENNES